MPEISRFYGIKISLYSNGHNPPHFHAEYGDYKALVDIKKNCIIKGFLPSKQLKLVQAWAILHENELIDNWDLASEGKDISKIPPLQ